MHHNRGLILACGGLATAAIAAACWISEPGQPHRERDLAEMRRDFADLPDVAVPATNSTESAAVSAGSAAGRSAELTGGSAPPNEEQPVLQLISSTSETSASPLEQLFPSHAAESAEAQLTVAQVAELIDVEFPQAERELKAVWSESLAGLTAVDVSEILGHKKRSGAGLALRSMATSTFLQPDFEIFPEATSSPAAGTLQPDLRVLLISNLRNAWTPGFRANIPLTDPLSADSHQSAFVHGVIRDFSAGRTISSPHPLHVAIRDSGEGMFLMADGRLTRRGNFCVLQDQTLGLQLADGSLAVAGSPQIIVPQQQVSIDLHGQILVRDSAGQTVAGRISVMIPQDTSGLQSEDGVLFEVQDSSALTSVAADKLLLSPRTLEMSNVDVAECEQRLRWQAGDGTVSSGSGGE